MMQTPLPEQSPSATNKRIQETRLNRRSLFLKLVKLALSSILGLLVILVISVVITVSLLVNSQNSREWLVLNAIPAVLSYGPYKVHIKGLNSKNIGHWYFETLSIHNDDELLFNASSLLFKFDAAAILEKKIDITELSADNLNFILIPSEEPVAPSQDTNSALDWKSLLIPVRLQNLNLRKVIIDGTELVVPHIQVTGDLSLFWENNLITTNLSVQPLENPSAHYKLETTIDKQYLGTAVASIKESPGGWLAKLMGIPKSQNLDFTVKTKAYADENTIYFNLSSFTMPFHNYLIQAHGEATLDISSHKLTIPNISVLLDNHEQSFNGWWHEHTYALNSNFKNFPIDITSSFQDELVGGHINGTINANGSLTKPFVKLHLATKTNYKGEILTADINGEGGIDIFNIQEAKINYGPAALNTSGAINIDKQELDLLVHQLTGPVNIIEKFDLSLPKHLLIQISETKGSLIGPFTSPLYEGFTKATGHYENQNFLLEGYFKGDISKINLTNTLIHSEESLISSNGLIDWHNETLKLAVTAEKLPIQLLRLFDLDFPEELFSLTNTNLDITGTFSRPDFSGLVTTAGTYNNKDFDVETHFEADLTKISLKNLIANLDGGLIKSSGIVDWENNQLDLLLASENLPISLLDLIEFKLPSQLKGRSNIKGRISGILTSPNFEGSTFTKLDFQQRHFKIKSEINSSPDELQLDKLSVSISESDENNDENTLSSIEGNGQYRFASQEIVADLSLKSVPYNILSLAGIELPASLKGTINADLSISEKLPFPLIRGHIESAGEFEGEEFYLNIEGSQQDKSLFFNETRLKWNNTVLSANGRAGKDNLNLHISLSELNLEDLNKFGYSFKPGQLNANIQLLGDADAPILDGLCELRLENKDYLSQLDSEILITTSIKTQTDRLLIHTDVAQGQETKGYLAINSQFSPFLNWLFDATDSRTIRSLPLDIETQGNIGLNWINNFIDRDIQNLSGNLTLNTHIGGSINKPRIKGTINLEQGKYQNALSQTSIENTQIQLVFDEKSITIVKAEANDGQKGKLSLKGNAELSDTNNGLINVTLR